MILEAMEIALRTKFAESNQVPRGLTVEHVMPQAWQPHWPLPIASDSNPEARRNSLIHTIGNLTLVNKRLNPAQSNKAWVLQNDSANEKRSLLKASSTLFLNKSICEHETWDEVAIEQRTRALFDVAVQIWPSPFAGDEDFELPLQPNQVDLHPSSVSESDAYLYHRAGSRKSVLHRFFDENGGDVEALIDYAATLPIPDGKQPLKESTLRSWASDWRGGKYHQTRLAEMDGETDE
jgi:hypothetical protein